MAMASASRRIALSAVQNSSLKLSARLCLPYRLQSCRSIAVMAQGRLPLRTRSFATEAAPSGAPKKAPAKKTKGKATARKLKAKPKKKAKAKPKPKRKVLTSAQKELLQKRRQREEIARLKEQALSLPYMKASSAYKIFMKQQLPALEGSPPDKVRQIGQMWKALSPAELETLNDAVRANKAENEKAYRDFVARHTPDQIRLANIARRRLQRLIKRSSRHVGRTTVKIADGRQVKGPQNMYIIFAQERGASGDFDSATVAEAGRRIGAAWQALSPLEKKKYADLAAADKERFKREYEQTYGHAIPTRDII